jgi:ribose-phosphate pyrophosphokinase
MAIATHLVLCGEARQGLQQAGIRRVFGTDTYPGVQIDSLLDIYSVAPLIAEELSRHLRVSPLPAPVAGS